MLPWSSSNFGLLPWRTVRDNVGFGLELASVPKVERLQRVEQQLELVGLSSWGDKYVHELSGGMQQRVGLARAFATDAPILLMDEPFSALDPLIRSRLQDELLDLQEKLHRTIIFVSHDLDEAAKIGNRIAIMEGGHVVQIGTPQEIVKNPADEYVASFVAHMNPLNVLHAEDVMSPYEDVKTELSVSVDEMPKCSAKQTIREVIELKRKSSGPVAVFRNNRPIGIIREQEIMDCFV